MANSPQAKKRARQNASRFAVNKMRRSRIRTYLRAVEEAIASGDKDAAQAALKAAHESGLPACINVRLDGRAAPKLRRQAA